MHPGQGPGLPAGQPHLLLPAAVGPLPQRAPGRRGRLLLLELLIDMGAQHPVQHAPGPEVAGAEAVQMRLGVAGHAADEEVRRHQGVAAVGEGLLEGDEAQVHDVGDHVLAPENDGDDGGEPAAEEVGEGVVVVRGERVGGAEGVVPFGVEAGEGVVGVEDPAVDGVAEDLYETPKIRQNEQHAKIKNRPES